MKISAIFTLTFGTILTFFLFGSQNHSFASVAPLHTNDCNAVSVWLPIVQENRITYFDQPWEQEPNDSYQAANGPLISGADYKGYPNNERDFFSIYLATDGQITINLRDNPSQGTQILLYYKSTGEPEFRIYDYEAPFIITYNGIAGWYYILIFTSLGNNNITPYTLQVNYPVLTSQPIPTLSPSTASPTCTPTGTPVLPMPTGTPADTPIPLTPTPTSSIPAPQLFESFESPQGVSNWHLSDESDNCATGIDATPLHVTDGSAAARLLFNYQQSVGGRCFYKHDIAPHQDWRNKGRLVFDFWKDGPPIEVSVVVMTGNFFWQESPVRVPLVNGQNTIEFDLTSNEWNGQTIKNLDDVLQLGIALYPSADGAGELFVDNIRLLASSTSTPTPTLTSTSTPTSSVPAPQLFESFESPQGVSQWELSDDPDNCATGIDGTTLHVTDGSAAARFRYTYQQSVGGRCFYQRDINPHQDWSGKGRLVLDFWKDGPPIEVSVVVMTGNFFWQESPVRILLVNGQNTIEFDLTSNEWNGQTIKNLDDVLQLGIALYPSVDGAGELFVDNVRLLASSTNTPTATPRPTSQYGYNFESSTQTWTTSEGASKPITVTTNTQVVYSGVQALQLNPNLRGGDSDIYQHTEAVAYFSNTIPEGMGSPGPYNLAGNSVACYVYLPSTLAPSGNSQAYIRLFVKDKDFRNQFSDAVSIVPSNVNQWFQLILTVGVGGSQDSGFKSNEVNALGIRIELQNGATLIYTGPIYIDHCTIQQP